MHKIKYNHIHFYLLVLSIAYSSNIGAHFLIDLLCSHNDLRASAGHLGRSYSVYLDKCIPVNSMVAEQVPSELSAVHRYWP